MHVFLVEDEECKYSQETWAQVASKQVATKLKTVPVHRAFLNKKGQGCIVLPTEENRKAAVAALEADFKVTTNIKITEKKILLKIKINNLNQNNFNDKNDFKKAILEKNDELRKCLENSEESIFDILFLAKNKDENPIYAIVKVCPDIKNIALKNTRLYINMSSHKVTDYYH